MAQHQRKNAGEQVITANRLIDGVVVYWSASGWAEALAQAQVFNREEAKAALDKIETASIVDAYFFEIDKKEGGIIPVSVRERIRAEGPTV